MTDSCRDSEKLFSKAMDFFREEKLREAADLYRELITSDPDNRLFKLMLGWTILLDDRPEESLPIFESLASKYPKWKRASLGLFHSLWDTEQEVAALEEMKRFLVIKPDSREYPTLRRELLAELDEKLG